MTPPHPPHPAPPPRPADLPHPLTFFLTAHQRRAVLRALRRTGRRDRADALLAALSLTAATADPPHQQQQHHHHQHRHKGGPHDDRPRTQTDHRSADARPRRHRP